MNWPRMPFPKKEFEVLPKATSWELSMGSLERKTGSSFGKPSGIQWFLFADLVSRNDYFELPILSYDQFFVVTLVFYSHPIAIWILESSRGFVLTPRLDISKCRRWWTRSIYGVCSQSLFSWFWRACTWLGNHNIWLYSILIYIYVYVYMYTYDHYQK